MRASRSRHGQAVVNRRAFPLAFETGEHLSPAEKERFEALLPDIESRFGRENLIVSNSAKDPHRLEKNRVWVRRFDGSLLPMAEASDFIAQVSRIDCFRVYTPRDLRADVAATVKNQWRSAS